MSAFTVFTIADPGFLPGLAGLVNSIRRSGFDGPIVVGTPVPLPSLDGTNGVRVVVLDRDPLWVAFLKARLLLSEAADRFVFFDADIVVSEPGFLSRLDALTSEGPLLALEALLNPRDPRRTAWAARLGGSPPTSDGWAYYNSGFLAGRMHRDRGLIEAWDTGMRRALAGVAGFRRDPDFAFGDQDVLNGVLQTWSGAATALQFPDWWSALAPVNPFLHVGALPSPAFYHAMGPKPWRLETAPPRDPSPYETAWFRHAIVEPSPLSVPIELPGTVRRWLSVSRLGRVEHGGRRLWARVKAMAAP